MSNICVIHLVRKKNGIEPFRSFLSSYLNNHAGVDHDILIVYKGFYRNADISPYEELLKDVPHAYIKITDIGFDLRAYFIAAEKHESQYYCFLNSFSVILDKDWLLKLYRQITQPAVGLVGASGSWGQIRPGKLNKNASVLKRMVWFFFVKWPGMYLGAHFNPFPNYHIRTNGFMIARDNMLKIRHGIILTKMQAWVLESGKNSITKQIERMGLKPVVVGKNGKVYDKHNWDVSSTFWRGAQDNLLIADNQTKEFDLASEERRRESELFAWGALMNESRNKIGIS